MPRLDSQRRPRRKCGRTTVCPPSCWVWKWRGWACGAALAALLLVTCTDNPIGPARPGLARLRVAPQFDAFARVAPLAMDRFTITVVRPPADTLARVTKTFSPDSSAVSVPIDIFLQSTSETVDVTIELYAGSILLFRGTQSLTVTQGGSTPPSSIPVMIDLSAVASISQ